MNINCHIKIFLLLLVLFPFHTGSEVKGQTDDPGGRSVFPSVAMGRDGKLIYTSDSAGNRIPDFSYCGYASSEKEIPQVPVKIIVPSGQGDATFRIQRAIDYISSLPADADGFRGTVLLGKGIHRLSGRLVIRTSGVVIRGMGPGIEGTTLIAAGKSRETLITVKGINELKAGEEIPVIDDYVPVNSMNLRVPEGKSFTPGDQVSIHRPSTAEWINLLGMKEFGGETEWLGWKPGQRDIYWNRKIIAVEGNVITLDAPVTTALDKKMGGGFIQSVQWQGQIHRVGIENLALESEYDPANPKDEQHCWSAITMENVSDGWVRQVTFRHFAGSAVAIFETAQRITVEDCLSLEPVSEIAGFRRNTFFTMGQQTLFQRLYAEYGYHDFATGFCAAGPNAFVQCESRLPFSFSGAIDSWASGVLFDIVNIDGGNMSFKNREQDHQGAGWCAANSMMWQCTASKMECYAPPGAWNWAYGAWAQFAGNGTWADANNAVSPRSLFYAQLAERLGKSKTDFIDRILPDPGNPTSSPTIEQAAAMNAKARLPLLTLKDFIGNAARRNPIDTSADKVKTIDEIPLPPSIPPFDPDPLQLANGWLVTAKKGLVTGSRHEIPWWRGDPRPYETGKAKPAITRFVPGRTGTGYTDDLQEVVNWMTSNRISVLEHNYGLWYDRRRDDHERVRRADGDSWAPFYELPFARSGKDTAWDNLSKYDLTKYNDWYWNRLKHFADLAGQKGLLMVHQHYFQHNILEAGAHWADFPWRTANNINATGFPEPPPYAGDKRIFMDEWFYDLSDPVRREIHRSYIRKCLDNFSGNKGVIHLISAEYTGPLHFVRFWLDIIGEWEKETGKPVLIGLSTTKDVQDSILADKTYASLIDVIDIRYWSYRADGTLYAPRGGQHLAPRQHARLVPPGNRSFESVYRSVSEYRNRFPEKAVIYSEGDYNRFPWAICMAGGSLANLPVISVPGFLKAVVKMKPTDMAGEGGKSYALGDALNGYIIYAEKGAIVRPDQEAGKKKYRLFRIDPVSGKEAKPAETVKGGKIITLVNDTQNDMVIWLKPE